MIESDKRGRGVGGEVGPVWDGLAEEFLSAYLRKRRVVLGGQAALVVGPGAMHVRLRELVGPAGRVYGATAPAPFHREVAGVDPVVLERGIPPVDVIHARSTLRHPLFTDVVGALIRALRPGGIILVEETAGPVDGVELWPGPGAAAGLQVINAARQVYSLSGSVLPVTRDMHALLDVVGHQARPHWRGGSPGAVRVAAYLREHEPAVAAFAGVHTERGVVESVAAALEGERPDVVLRGPLVTRIVGTAPGPRTVQDEG